MSASSEADAAISCVDAVVSWVEAETCSVELDDCGSFLGPPLPVLNDLDGPARLDRDRPDQRGNFGGRALGLLGQLAHLVGDDREPAALLPGPGGFDRRVQREQLETGAERGLTLIVCVVGIVVDTLARCVDRRRDGYVCGSDRRLAQRSLLGASRHTHAQLEDPHSEGCAWHRSAKRGYGLAGGRESGCGREWEASWWTAYQD